MLQAIGHGISPMAAAGWVIATACFSTLFGVWIQHVRSKKNCQFCGITELRADIVKLNGQIARLCNLIRALA